MRRRGFPIVGDGGGVFPFIHVDDAAAATVAAIERGKPGVYNVVDDDPAPLRDWLPVYARGDRREAAAAGARRSLARIAAGKWRPRRHEDARRVEREGQARARLGAALPELARRASSRLRGQASAPISSASSAAWSSCGKCFAPGSRCSGVSGPSARTT